MFAAQNDRLDPSRVISGMLQDLRVAKPRTDASIEWQDRYRVATLHLQELLDRLHRSGSFDRGRLTVAEGETQVYIDHLPMEEPIRQRLVRDLEDLRRMGEKHSPVKSERAEPDLQ